MQFWAVIVDSLRESLHRKIFWVLAALTGLIVLMMLNVGFKDNQISFMFGLWSMENEFYNPLSALGASRLVGVVLYIFLAAILGWIGVILMIIATADVFPSIMERGTIDIVLSKPISRMRFFLYKYVSSMVFVLLQATWFVVLTFLVMGFRWGVWRPGYLLSVPLLVLLFSYVFCVSVFVGVKTRSAMAAILVSIAAWAVFALVHQVPQIFDAYPSLKEHKTIYNTLRIISWIPPKTGDFDYLAARWANVGPSMDMFPSAMMSSSEKERDQMNRARKVEKRQLLNSPVLSIGSSLLFEGVVVLLAMWSFSRRDY